MRKAIFIFFAIILVAVNIDWIHSCADQWITLVIESHVMHSDGMSLQAGMDSLAQVLQACDIKKGKDYFVLTGPQYENGSRIDGYSYYTKIMANHKL